MKTFFLLFFLVLSAALYGQSFIADSLAVYTKYLVHLPAAKPASGKYPLFLFLHGAGERGNDLSVIRKAIQYHFIKDSVDFPFLLVAPLCPADQNWNAQALLNLLDEIERRYPVDRDREYVSGMSLGGYGTWELAMKAGDRFAAIAPVCGGGSTDNSCMMRHTPVWAFHGKKDTWVPYSEAVKLTEAVHKLGGTAKLTLYDDVEHNAWDRAYSNPELYSWLLSCRRSGAGFVLPVSEQKKYCGLYLYSYSNSTDTLHTFIRQEQGALYYSVPRHGFKAKIIAVNKHLFRLENIPYAKDSELFFELDAAGKINGHYYYPCDNTFVPLEKK